MVNQALLWCTPWHGHELFRQNTVFYCTVVNRRGAGRAAGRLSPSSESCQLSSVSSYLCLDLQALGLQLSHLLHPSLSSPPSRCSSGKHQTARSSAPSSSQPLSRRLLLLRLEFLLTDRLGYSSVIPLSCLIQLIIHHGDSSRRDPRDAHHSQATMWQREQADEAAVEGSGSQRPAQQST